MRGAATAIAAAMLGACGTSAEPQREPLAIDLVRYADSVRVYVHDPAAPDACTNGFPAVGVTDRTTDELLCQPELAPWIVEVELVSGGTALDTQPWSPPEWPSFGLAGGGTTIVFVGDQGDRHELPVPDAADLAIAIDDVQMVPVNDIDATYFVTWSAPGAGSAVMEISGGFGGPRTHVALGTDGVLDGWIGGEINSLQVRALAAPTVTARDLGDVRIWRASESATRDLRNP